LIGPNATNNWTLTSTNSGTESKVAFVNFGNLTGGTGGAAGAVSNIQNVHGGNGGNTLTGNAQGNSLIGGSGANSITGGSGRSLLIADTRKFVYQYRLDGSIRACGPLRRRQHLYLCYGRRITPIARSQDAELAVSVPRSSVLASPWVQTVLASSATLDLIGHLGQIRHTETDQQSPKHVSRSPFYPR